jgi:hypothetical protein
VNELKCAVDDVLQALLQASRRPSVPFPRTLNSGPASATQLTQPRRPRVPLSGAGLCEGWVRSLCTPLRWAGPCALGAAVLGVACARDGCGGGSLGCGGSLGGPWGAGGIPAGGPPGGGHGAGARRSRPSQGTHVAENAVDGGVRSLCCSCVHVCVRLRARLHACLSVSVSVSVSVFLTVCLCLFPCVCVPSLLCEREEPVDHLGRPLDSTR